MRTPVFLILFFSLIPTQTGTNVIRLTFSVRAPATQILVPIKVSTLSNGTRECDDEICKLLVSEMTSEFVFYQTRLEQDMTALEHAAKMQMQGRRRQKRFDVVAIGISAAAFAMSSAAMGTAAAALSETRAMAGKFSELRKSTEHILKFANKQREMNAVLRKKQSEMETKMNLEFARLTKAVIGLDNRTRASYEAGVARRSILKIADGCVNNLLACPLDSKYIGSIPELTNLHYLTEVSASGKIVSVVEPTSMLLKSVTFTEFDPLTHTVSAVITVPVYPPSEDMSIVCSVERADDDNTVCYADHCVFSRAGESPLGWGDFSKVVTRVTGGYLPLSWWQLFELSEWSNSSLKDIWSQARCTPRALVKKDPCFNIGLFHFCDCDIAVCSRGGNMTEIETGVILIKKGWDDWNITVDGIPLYTAEEVQTIDLGLSSSPVLGTYQSLSLDWDDFDQIDRQQYIDILLAEHHLEMSKYGGPTGGIVSGIVLLLIFLVAVCVGVFFLYKKHRREKSARGRL